MRVIASGTLGSVANGAEFYPVGRSRSGVRRDTVWLDLLGGVGTLQLQAKLDGTNWANVGAAVPLTAALRVGVPLSNALANTPHRIAATAWTSGSLVWKVLTE
jgi:hypothetical protein